MSKISKSLRAVFRRARDWARRRNVTRIRYGLAGLVVLAGVVLFIGSRQVESWQSCKTIERGNTVERECRPPPPTDLIVVVILIGAILWPELELVTVAGVGGIRRRVRTAGSDQRPSEPESARSAFLEDWEMLDPWSRLASRLASRDFREKLVEATEKPGALKRGALGRHDHRLAKQLEIGPQFSAPEAEAWVKRSQGQLDALRDLADESHQSSEEQYTNGRETVRELLAELRESGLRA